MAHLGQAPRAERACLRFAAQVLPSCLALVLASGRTLAEPSGALTLPPAMFFLELSGRPEARSSGQLTLLRDLTFDEPADLRSGALSDLQRPRQLTLFRGLTFGVPPAPAGFGERFPGETASAPLRAAARPPSPRSRGLLRPVATGGVMALALAASFRNSLKEPSGMGYRFTAEGFFGSSTYAGGADKAAHFVDYTIAWRLMDTTYRGVGHADSNSRWLAAGTAFAAGLATEIGDGTSLFGFSFEDLLMDALGIATAMGLSRSGWDDTFGFRYGSGVPQESNCCATDTYGRDYSGEIYTADFKIAGIGRRLRFDPGPARFLLVSGTYGTNGYRNAAPGQRQRLVGLEVGIHFSEILRSLGVPDKAFWGEILYVFFDSIRIPYTAIGVRYDLNHHQWFGPTASGKTPFPQTGSR